MAYTNPFGGLPQNPSQVYLKDFSLTADLVLYWPWSGQQTDDVAAKIMRITTDADGRNVAMPVASQASNGEASIIINTGSHTFNVNDSAAGNIASIAAGTAKFIYLIDNTTDAGTWGVFTFGTGSSGADASALAGAGLLALSGTLNEELLVTDFSSTGYNLTSSSRANMYNWTGGSDAATTDDPSTLGTGWFAALRNSGSGTLSLTPAAGTIDGAASKNFNPGDAAFIVRDGGNLVTIGFGQSTSFTFDYIAINVAGSGSYTLNTSEQNRVSYKFTGVLSGDRTIIVPATVQQYWVTNATTGAHTFSVRTAAQTPPGPVIATGAANILYCDGTNVVVAVSGSGISTPVSVANGGTGATTASGAVSNLGGTTVGAALFTAATAAAAASAINAAVINANNNFSANQTVISTDSGATVGPIIAVSRNSASPIVGDLLGVYDFIGKDSAGNDTIYSRLNTIIVDPTDGVETGSFLLQIPYLGALKNIIQIGTSATVGSSFSFSSFDAGAAVGPTVNFSRDSASPAASDLLAIVQFLGRNSGGGFKTYAQISAQILDTTSASEDGVLLLGSIVAGTAATRVSIGQGMFTTGATGGDKGAGTVNATEFYKNGVALVTTNTVIQVVNVQSGSYATGTTTIPLDNSIPQITEGTEFLTASITPTSATSKLRIEVTGIFYNNNAGTATIMALFQDSTANALTVALSGGTSGSNYHTITTSYFMTAGTTSSTTFRMRAGPETAATVGFNGNATTRIFGGNSISSITITEFA